VLVSTMSIMTLMNWNICVQESCKGVVESTILEVDNNHFYMDYEPFSCGFDVNEGLDVDIGIEYEFFFF